MMDAALKCQDDDYASVAGSYELLGRLYLAMEDNQNAITCFTRGDEFCKTPIQNDTKVLCLNRLAKELWQIGQIDYLGQTLDKIQRIFCDFPNSGIPSKEKYKTALWQGMYFAKKGVFKRAFDYFKITMGGLNLLEEVDRDWFLMNYGVTARKFGDFENALDALNKINLSIDCWQNQVRLYKCLLYYDLGKQQECRQLLKELVPKDLNLEPLNQGLSTVMHKEDMTVFFNILFENLNNPGDDKHMQLLFKHKRELHHFQNSIYIVVYFRNKHVGASYY